MFFLSIVMFLLIHYALTTSIIILLSRPTTTIVFIKIHPKRDTCESSFNPYRLGSIDFIFGPKSKLLLSHVHHKPKDSSMLLV